MTLKTIGKTLGAAAVGSLLVAGSAFAQTSTTDVTGSTTVGTPNTGAGGDMAINLLVLGGTAAAAVAAIAYLRRQQA